MVWFKVDDGLAFHKKAVAAGNAALGLWVRAGAWCGQQLSDGHVPADIVKIIGTTAQADRLVKAGLWVEGDNEYIFHDWQQCNPLASGVRQSQKRAAVNQQSYRDRQKIKEIFSEDQGNFFLESGQTPRSEPVVSDNGPMAVVGSGKGSSSTTGKKKVTVPQSATPLPGTDGDPEFAAFWQSYPRKIGKGQARNAWRTAIKRADPAEIIAAAEKFALAMKGRDLKFVPHPATWLNGERWSDQEQQPELDVPWWEER